MANRRPTKQKKRQKVIFKGHSHDLSGVINFPEGSIKALVLYSHCFTCGKDFTASYRISRNLVKHGFAVFRFDFTGIGESQGDFSDTNFSTNVADILAAAEYLTQHYQAPQLLVGHSLGGTASIKAASLLPDCLAVACISSPAHANHIMHLWQDDVLADLHKNGAITVTLAAREFTIKKQFLDDLNRQKTEHIKNLDKALLVMHSPLDKVVAIEEAEKIYVKAKHPKSFISLDTADHLLSARKDTQYVADVIQAWMGRFIL
ncbi:MAG: lysophospholipase [Proteobacteria bacterium]|nr:lysophospholipase [Pseudomonadota bacterium]